MSNNSNDLKASNYTPEYKIPFKNRDNEDMMILVCTENAGNEGGENWFELVGGTPVFEIEYNSDEFLYTPTRFSGATLKVVGGDYLQSLFTTDYHFYKVLLKKGDQILWNGFVTPEIYSQDYSSNQFELEIECVSAMSTLQYIKFEHNADKISFKDLIIKCVNESKGEFDHIFIPKSYTENLSDIFVSCGNFEDEEGEKMTLDECL